MSLTINGIDAATMRFVAGWNGVWTAEVDIGASPTATVPSGKATIVSTEGISLVGTVDPARAGTFGEKRFARVIGGAAGWAKAVRAQHYHSDVAVKLSDIATTTAAEVGETVTMLVDAPVGGDYARRADVASQVFVDTGVDWWVGLDGITRVGVRPPLTAPVDLRILDWNPAQGTVSFSAPTLIEPGTVIVDERLGTRVVRQVEADVSNASVTGTLWVALAAAPVGTIDDICDGLAELARAATRSDNGRFYEYRVVDTQADGRVNLQAVTPGDGVPDLLPAVIWPGVSGYKAKPSPSSHVLVGFRAGDQRYPFVAFFQPTDGNGWHAVEVDIDAVESVNVGASAAAVLLGGGASPIALMTPDFATWIAAVSTFINGLAPATVVPPLGISSARVKAS